MMKRSEFEAQRKAPAKSRLSRRSAGMLLGLFAFYALAYLSLSDVWPSAIFVAFALPWLGVLLLKLKGKR